MMDKMTGNYSMVPAILCLAGGLLLVGPAFGQGQLQTTGRYQIERDGDGFVRLDTETGTLTYCEKSEEVWRCEVLVEGDSDADGRVLALQRRLAELDAEVAAMAERLAAIEGGEEPPPAPSDDQRRLSEEQEKKEFDEALSFAERMMQRFFDMIREFKDEAPPQQI